MRTRHFFRRSFEALFRDGLQSFHGPAIERTWRDDGKCTFIRFDFSRVRKFTDAEGFRFKLSACLRTALMIAGFSGAAAKNLKAPAPRLPKRSIVRLIDEYDAALAAAL